MQLVTVGSKYQIVIPKDVRKKIQGLKPGDKVSVHQIDQNTISIQSEPENWVERTRGIAKEAWKGINTTKYLDNLRNEWDRNG